MRVRKPRVFAAMTRGALDCARRRRLASIGKCIAAM
jgi:hypothetical protein